MTVVGCAAPRESARRRTRRPRRASRSSRTSSPPTTRRATSRPSWPTPSPHCPAGRALRDHRRQRWLQRSDGSPGRWLGGSARRDRPGRPPPDEPRLRRSPPLGIPRRPVRLGRLHRRRPAVRRRRPRPADRPDRGAGRGRCRRRLPDPAGRPVDPDPLCPLLSTGQPDLLRPEGQRRRLRLQALPAGVAARACASSPAARSFPRSS